MTESTRIPKRRGYTVIPNGLLPEGKISARAWGIYAYLLSRPEGWIIHVRQLQQVFKEGRDAIYAAMKQLREVGLLEMESYQKPGQPPKKRYVLADIEPVLSRSPDPGFQDTAFQDTGKPDTGNQDLNQYLLKPSLKKSNTDKTHSASFVGVEPTALSKLGARGYPQGYTQVDPYSGIEYPIDDPPPPF